jgi:hypothetical protein
MKMVVSFDKFRLKYGSFMPTTRSGAIILNPARKEIYSLPEKHVS